MRPNFDCHFLVQPLKKPRSNDNEPPFSLRSTSCRIYVTHPWESGAPPESLHVGGRPLTTVVRGGWAQDRPHRGRSLTKHHLINNLLEPDDAGTKEEGDSFGTVRSETRLEIDTAPKLLGHPARQRPLVARSPARKHPEGLP